MKKRNLIKSLLAGAAALTVSAFCVMTPVSAKADTIDVGAYLRSDTGATAEHVPGTGIVATNNPAYFNRDVHIGTQGIPFGAETEVTIFFSVPIYEESAVNEQGLVDYSAVPQTGTYGEYPPDTNKYAHPFRIDLLNQNGESRCVQLQCVPNQTQITAEGMLCNLYTVCDVGWQVAFDGRSGEYYTRLAGAPTAETVYGFKFTRSADNACIMVWDSVAEDWYAPESFKEDAVGDFFDETTALYVDFVQWRAAATDPTLEVHIKSLNGVNFVEESEVPTTPKIKVGHYEKYHLKGGFFELPSFSATYGATDAEVTKTAYDPDGNAVRISNGKISLEKEGKYKVVFSPAPAKVGDFEAGAHDRVVEIWSVDTSKGFAPDLNLLTYLNYRWGNIEEFWDERGYTVVDGAYNNMARGASLGYDYDCSTDEMHTLTFSIPIYDSNGQILSDKCSSATHGVDSPDIVIRDSKNLDLALRIRMVDSYSEDGETTLNLVYDSLNGERWKDRFVSVKLAGTFTANSSFTIGVSGKVNEHLTVLAPDGTMRPIGSENGTIADQEALEIINAFFAEATTVEVHFVGYWAAASNDKVDATNNFAISFIEIDGQCLKTLDGKVVDIKAPVVGKVVPPAKVTEFKSGTSYVFTTEIVSEVFEDMPQRSLVYRKKGETEWISTGTFDSTSWKLINCRFAKSGLLEVCVKATDTSGNVGYGPIMEINVLKDYEITINGTVPEQGQTGQKIVLPSATATDKNGEERTVTITIENVYGKTFEMGADNSFTPTEVGTYYIIYQSSYVDEGGKTVKVSQEFTLMVTQGTTKKSSGGGCSSAVTLPTVVTLLGAAVLIVLNRKRR